MKNVRSNLRTIAVLSLVANAFLGAVMGVWVRLLSPHFFLFQQIAARALAGAGIGFLVYAVTGHLKISSLRRMSRKDAVVITARAAVLLIGIGFFTFAINHGNFSNVNMIYALPSTAILGIIILKDRANPLKIVSLAAGCLGVILISVKNLSGMPSVGIGEFAAFLSTFFYSLSYIMRRFISRNVTNEEMAVAGSAVMGICALTVSLFIGDPPGRFTGFGWDTGLVIFVAGLTFILIGVTNNYGFERLDTLVANNIMMLDPVFGVLIGAALYEEVPTVAGFIGGVLIILSAVAVNYVDAVGFRKNIQETAEPQ